jgi:hypothetical protein
MASFEQNQQNQVNMNNSIDQVKQFQAELDKATEAIGAAELAAEEELQEVRLKNLAKQQQTKLEYLDSLIELEEKSIQALAKLKLTLSKNQFAARKKEIQKEFQLYKAAADEFFKSESKRKFARKPLTPDKKGASSDAGINDINKAVQAGFAGVRKVRQELNDAISSLQETAQSTAAPQVQQKPLPDQKIDSDQTLLSSEQPLQEEPKTGQKIESTEKDRKFSADAKLLDKVALGSYSPEAVFSVFDSFRDTMDSGLKGLFDKVFDQNGKTTASQDTIDFAGDLLKSYKEADAAEKALNKLKKDGVEGELNRSLILAEEEHNLRKFHAEKEAELIRNGLVAEAKARDLENNKTRYLLEETAALENAYKAEQNKLTEDEYKRKAQLDYLEANEKKLTEQNLAALRSQHADEEIQRRREHIKALARSIQLEEDRATLLEDAKKKLADEHTTKQNDLKQGAIDNDAKAADLQENRDQYIFEARMAHENAFYAERNRLEEEAIQAQEAINWNAAHADEIMQQELQKKRLGYLKEYQSYQLKAGKYAVDQKEFERDKARKDRDAAKKAAVSGINDGLKKFGTGEFSMTDLKQSYSEYMGQRTAELEESGLDENSAKLSAQFELLAAAAGDLMDSLDASVRKMADMQGFIDTRLQGSKDNNMWLLSYGKQLLRDAKSIAGASPFIKQEKLVENMRTLVDKGISYHIKQRAFLMTIQEKVASTFDAADATLLRLIRIQQQDSTAGRLGMESALNSFLNSMYETSEYLESVAKSVRGSLEEMQALMEGKDAAELEYQVQKWMGSLYSVGMSDSAVQSIAQTFGQIASGDVSGLTGSGTGNLLIMAANEAGMSIADILQDGLKADETNKLMQAMVNYLAEIAEASSDSKVVQQQLANVYGIKASDLRAAANLSTSTKDVSKTNKSYFDMMMQLNLMANTIGLRTSISEGMTNMWDNIMYSMASTQASNPILYLLPKMANLLKDVTGGEGGGGIALPFLNVYGFGVDLNTTVSDLMLVASMAGTALGALGPAVTGLVDLVNPLAGTMMMMRAGINPLDGALRVLARGTPATLQNTSGASTSESGQIVGNSSGDDIKNATLQDAEDSKKKQMVEAKEEETADDVAMKADLAVVNIYNLLEEVAHGSQSLRVRVINGGVYTGNGSNNNNNPISGKESDGNTTESVGAGKYGSDNGNWVLSF